MACAQTPQVPARHRCITADTSVPEEHGAAHPQAALSKVRP